MSDGDIGEDVLLTADFHAGLTATAGIDEVRPAGSVAVNVGWDGTRDGRDFGLRTLGRITEKREAVGRTG
jgi:hypothetical protein